VRVLDCVDCHNRPHIFDSPYSALDASLWLGVSILPFLIKAKAAGLWSGRRPSQAVIELIAQKLSKEYLISRTSQRSAGDLRDSEDLSGQFFPEMKTDWKVRPDNIGHYIWPGCFRCHDGSHVDQTGRAISNECNACHIITSQGSQPEPKTVSLQGLKFDHPGGEIPPEMLCSDCHTGAP
jgi:hypothetical protein